jgi:AcrR family transcriptional regulator
MSAAATIGLRDRRRSETRAEILAAARSLFAEQGYGSTRTTDIATRAGVSDATLFRYFASKSAIALAGTAEHIDTAIDLLRAQPDDLSDLGAARAVLREVLAQQELGPDAAALTEVALAMGVPELQGALDTMINSAAFEAARALAERHGRERPTVHDRVQAHTIVGAIQAAAESWFDDPTGRPPEVLLTEAFSLLHEDRIRQQRGD